MKLTNSENVGPLRCKVLVLRGRRADTNSSEGPIGGNRKVITRLQDVKRKYRRTHFIRKQITVFTPPRGPMELVLLGGVDEEEVVPVVEVPWVEVAVPGRH